MAETGDHKGQPNKAMTEQRADWPEEEVEGTVGPKDHSAEADVALHAANPLKEVGRHRGKEISEEGSGMGVRSRVRSRVRSF